MIILTLFIFSSDSLYSDPHNRLNIVDNKNW